MATHTTRTVLILGAAGGLGSEAALAFSRAGWRVRGLHRRASAPVIEGAESMTWIQGDAMDRASVAAAAEGADAIVHAVNPPGYRRWTELVLPMIDNTIAAAQQAGARIVLPGNVYNYGLDVSPLVAEDAPQAPTTVKGRVRVELERRLAHSGAPTLILRCGDFFGPRAGHNWFDQLVKPGAKAITNPGRRGVGHQWAYLPDVAATMVALLDRDLPPFARFHLGAHYDPDGETMIRTIQAALGRPEMPVRRFPWWLISALSPVAPLCRELREMRYLWRRPLQLDGGRLEATLGEVPHTPWLTAVREALIGQGCLSPVEAARAMAQPAVGA